eukprot:s379_g26.t1
MDPDSSGNSSMFENISWRTGLSIDLTDDALPEEQPLESLDELFAADFSEVQSVAYEPSLAPTDFSGYLPWHYEEDEVPLTEDYRPEVAVQSAWNSLQSDSYKLPWETGFWDQFLDFNVTVWEQMTKGIKRPMPVPHVELGSTATSSEVDRRVVSKTFPTLTSFLKNIRDVPEKSWQEEPEAKWEVAIRRWVALIDSWNAGDSLLIQALHECTSFTEKAQILVDVFYNKAPQTFSRGRTACTWFAQGCTVVVFNSLATKLSFTPF